MITGELKSQVDKIWEAFLTGSTSNPLTVIEQFTFSLSLRRLDERQLLEEKKVNIIGKKWGTAEELIQKGCFRPIAAI